MVGRIMRHGIDQLPLPRLQNAAVRVYSCKQRYSKYPDFYLYLLPFKQLFNYQLLIRPPGTVVPDGLMFYCWCFFLFRHAFSEVPRPIALKLCHVVGIWLKFIIPLQKFGGHSPQKNWGPKTCKISVNFGPLQTLIANISGTRQHIQNGKDVPTRKIPPAFNVKSPVNFGPLTAWNYMWVWTH